MGVSLLTRRRMVRFGEKYGNIKFYGAIVRQVLSPTLFPSAVA